MMKVILCVSLFVMMCSAQLRPYAVSAPLGLNEGYEPYQFGYNTADEFGTQWQRQETADGNGVVRGSYGYKDATGLFRTVEYHADPVSGFTANIQSNEPGVIPSESANARFNVHKRR